MNFQTIFSWHFPWRTKVVVWKLYYLVSWKSSSNYSWNLNIQNKLSCTFRQSSIYISHYGLRWLLTTLLPYFVWQLYYRIFFCILRYWLLIPVLLLALFLQYMCSSVRSFQLWDSSLTLTFVSLATFLLLWFGLSQIHGFGSIDLKRLQAENTSNVVPPTSRSSNYIALKYCDYPLKFTVRRFQKHIAFSSQYTFHLDNVLALLFSFEKFGCLLVGIWYEFFSSLWMKLSRLAVTWLYSNMVLLSCLILKIMKLLIIWKPSEDMPLDFFQRWGKMVNLVYYFTSIIQLC